MKPTFVALLLFFLCTAIFSAELRTISITVGKRTYDAVELALTPQARQKGLMFRTSLPENAGMLFVFPKEQPLAFWMKNTLIPLDIIYLNAKGNVVGIQHMSVPRPIEPLEPVAIYDYALPNYPSNEPAQFALEVNKGQIEASGVKLGDTIQLDTKMLLSLPELQ